LVIIFIINLYFCTIYQYIVQYCFFDIGLPCWLAIGDWQRGQSRRKTLLAFFSQIE